MIKKILVIALSLVFLALAVISCDVTYESSSSSEESSESNPEQSESSSFPQESQSESESQSNTPSQSESESNSESESTGGAVLDGFEFEASSTIYTVGQTEKITFKVKDGYTFDRVPEPIDIDVDIVETTASTMFDHTDNGIFFSASAPGKVTVKMSVFGEESNNTVTICVLPSESDLYQSLTTAMGYNCALGSWYQISSLPASLVEFYEIVDDNGFIRIKDDSASGKACIEVIGSVRSLTSFKFKCKETGNIYSIPYAMNGCGVSKAIFNTIDSIGQSIGQNVPHNEICAMTEINFSGVTTEVDDVSILSWMPNLKKINFGSIRAILFSRYCDLSKIEELTLLNNGDTVINHEMMDEMINLKKLSIVGSLDAISRQSFEKIAERVKAGTLEFEATDGIIIGANLIDDFGKSIFFTEKEVSDCLTANNGYLVSPLNYIIITDCNYNKDIKVKDIAYLDLYNCLTYPNPRAFTVKSECDDLTINLYNFNTSTENAVRKFPLVASGILRLNAIRGQSKFHGANGTTEVISSTNRSHENPTVAISAKTIYIKVATENGAKLFIEGGDGWVGWDGIDGKDGNNTADEKNAQTGGNGACGLYATDIFILSNGLVVTGGKGGNGGNGGDGAGSGIFGGGYNGGNGGNGGSGGAPIIYANSYTNNYTTTLNGGSGGIAGIGGSGYGLGSNGTGGTNGSAGPNSAVRE